MLIPRSPLFTLNKTTKSPGLDLQYFPGYAKFLLKNKLQEFVKAHLELSREIKLPLLKFFRRTP
jgi:hypothetical protein